MKLRHLLSLCLALGLFPVATAMTCKPAEQRLTYNSLYSIGVAVNGSYAAYMDQVVANKAHFNPAVAKAYGDFQAAFSIAVIAAQNNVQVIAPPNVVDLSNAVFAAIKEFSK